MKRFTPAAARSRRGFTLIELLVVISIIVTLMSLIAPAVQSARRAAQSLECLNNMRQVGVAMQNFATNNNGKLPPLNQGTVVTAVRDNMDAAINQQAVLIHGWPVTLLPFLDGLATYKTIKDRARLTGSVVAMATACGQPLAEIPSTEKVFFKAFTCPSDTNNDKTNGGLSFVANMGYVSSLIQADPQTQIADTQGDLALTTWWDSFSPGSINWNSGVMGEPGFGYKDGTTAAANGTRFNTSMACQRATSLAAGNYRDNSDTAVGRSSGVFFPEEPATSSFAMSLDYLSNGDGLTNTIMVSENLQAGNWTSADPTRIGFGIRTTVESGGNVLPVNNPFGVGVNNDLGPSGINRGLGLLTGQAPRPSSNHGGFVNCMMCDGSAKRIQEGIDNSVYRRLLSSNGQQLGQATLNQSDF